MWPMAKAKKKGTAGDRGKKRKDTFDNRRELATAMRSLAACVRASGVDPFNLVRLREVATSLGIPYVTALIAYYSNVNGAPLTYKDIEEWGKAEPWEWEVTRVVARELDAQYVDGALRGINCRIEEED